MEVDKNFFVSVSVFLQTPFLLAYNLFPCLQPLQTIYFKIFHPPPLPFQPGHGQGLKTGIDFAYFGLESGMVFEGATGVYERICRFSSR